MYKILKKSLLFFETSPHLLLSPLTIQTGCYGHSTPYITHTNFFHRLNYLICRLNEDDKLFLWSNRKAIHRLPKALPLVLASSFSWDPYQLPNIYPLLEKWAPLDAPTAVELLLPYFQDSVVRRHAVDYIRRAASTTASSNFLFNFLPQLVEALRYEPYEHSPLAVLLLELSSRERRFAMEVYWLLHLRATTDTAKNPSYSARCGLMKRAVLELGIPHLGEELQHQHYLLEWLDKLAGGEVCF